MTPDRAFEDAYPQVLKKHIHMMMSDGLDEVMAIHPIPLCVLAAVSDKEDPPLLP